MEPATSSTSMARGDDGTVSRLEKKFHDFASAVDERLQRIESILAKGNLDIKEPRVKKEPKKMMSKEQKESLKGSRRKIRASFKQYIAETGLSAADGLTEVAKNTIERFLEKFHETNNLISLDLCRDVCENFLRNKKKVERGGKSREQRNAYQTARRKLQRRQDAYDDLKRTDTPPEYLKDPAFQELFMLGDELLQMDLMSSEEEEDQNTNVVKDLTYRHPRIRDFFDKLDSFHRIAHPYPVNITTKILKKRERKGLSNRERSLRLIELPPEKRAIILLNPDQLPADLKDQQARMRRRGNKGKESSAQMDDTGSGSDQPLVGDITDEDLKQLNRKRTVEVTKTVDTVIIPLPPQPPEIPFSAVGKIIPEREEQQGSKPKKGRTGKDGK